MTKRQREAEAHKKPRRKERNLGRRRNALFGAYKAPVGVDGMASELKLGASPFGDVLGDAAGNILVYSALLGCSFEEKTMIAALIPLVIPILRKHGPLTVKQGLQSANAENPHTVENPEGSANTK